MIPDPRLPQFELSVQPKWIDANNHMNAAHYLAIIREPASAVHELWDYGTAFRARTGQSNFVVESEVIYLRELLLGDRIVVAIRLTEVAEKRTRILFEIFNKDRQYMAAIVQYVILHVEMGPPPKVAPIPDDLKGRLVEELARHREAPLPEAAMRLKGMPVEMTA